MKKITILAFMLAIALGAHAQNARVETNTKMDNLNVEYKTKYTSPITNNLFIQGAFAGSLLMGEDDSNLSFGERLRPGFYFSFGKKFTPLFGARLGFEGNSLKGWNDNDGGEYPNHNSCPRKEYLNSKGVDTSNGYEQDIRYSSFNIDLMFDLTNAITGNRGCDNDLEVELYAGLAALTTRERKGVDGNTFIAGRAGINATYDISKYFDLFIDLGTTLVGSEFDGHIEGHRSIDFITSAKVGFRWNISQRGFKTEYAISSSQYAALSNYLAMVKTKQMEKGEPEEKIVVLPAEKDNLLIPYVVFHDGKDTFNKELQMVNISNAAKLMNEHPEYIMEIVGNTNNTKAEIAESRANKVKEILVSRYSIDATKLVVKTMDMGEAGQTVHFVNK